MSLYDELGREDSIRVAVDHFYRRVVADPALAHHFAGVDIPRLRAHQVQLLASVTGGPQRYEGRDLAEAHMGLAITSSEFDRVVTHLDETLGDLGVEPHARGQVAEALAAHRDEIVTEVPSLRET
jgi:hemoglobin